MLRVLLNAATTFLLSSSQCNRWYVPKRASKIAVLVASRGKHSRYSRTTFPVRFRAIIANQSEFSYDVNCTRVFRDRHRRSVDASLVITGTFRPVITVRRHASYRRQQPRRNRPRYRIARQYRSRSNNNRLISFLSVGVVLYCGRRPIRGIIYSSDKRVFAVSERNVLTYHRNDIPHQTNLFLVERRHFWNEVF